MATTRLLLLGTLRIAGDTGEVTIATRSIARLLGYLALHAANGRVQSREVIADRLWPQRPGREARSALTNTLYATYQKLGPSAHRYVGSDAHALWLTNIERDIDRLELLANSTNPADWQQALSLYQGDLLVGLDDEWIDTPRHDLQNLVLGLFERLCNTLIEGGDLITALNSARRWSSTDPLNEQAHCVIMDVYARLGQTAAALRQFDYLRSLLLSELGVEPLPETQALAQSIRAQAGNTYSGQTLAINMQHSSAHSLMRSQVIRLVELTRADVPLGRQLHYDDRIMVRWTLDNGAEDLQLLRSYGVQALRKHRILRLLDEAAHQGATPTDRDLADALGVSRRTIESDMATLVLEGANLPTRRRSRR